MKNRKYPYALALAALFLSDAATAATPTFVLRVPMASVNTSAQLEVSPFELDFGAQDLGSTSSPSTVAVKNIGSFRQNVQVSAPTDAEFSLTSHCSVVEPSSSCLVEVSYAPTKSGVATGSFSVTSGSFSSTVSLNGSGVVPPSAQVTPSALTYSGVYGDAIAPQAVTLKNAGGRALTLAGVSSSSSTFTVSNACGSSLQPGESCQVNVSFVPTSAGNFSGQLNVSTNAGLVSVPLSGTAIQPAMASVSPGSLAFGQVTVNASSSAQVVTLTNTGGVSMNVQSVSSDNGQFLVSANSCGSTVAAGASCTLNVVYHPTSVGSTTGNLTLTTSGGTRSVALSGTATTPAMASASPTNLTYGQTAVASSSSAQVVTLTNTGGSPLSVQSVTSDSSQFLVSANSCGSSVAAGASCTLSVVYHPTTGGPATGTLTLTTSGGTRSVALSGTAFTTSGTLTVGVLNQGGARQAKDWGYLQSRGTGGLSLGVTPTGYTIISMYAGQDYYTPSVVYNEVFFCKDGACNVKYEDKSSITLTINGVTKTLEWWPYPDGSGVYGLTSSDEFGLSGLVGQTIPFYLY